MKNKWFDDLLEILYPRACVACNEVLLPTEEHLCIKCLLTLPKIENLEDVENKLKGKLPVEKVICMWKFIKHGKIQQLMHHLKYKNKPELGIYLGKLIAKELKVKYRLQNEIDILVGVPLHTSKQKQRGYNQAAKIAEGIGEILEIVHYENLLIRTTATESQTKKNRIERFENMNEKFMVQDINSVKGKKIAIIDDVLTTGATLEACGQVLLQAGCEKIYIITLASAI